MLIGKLAEVTGLSKDGIRHYEQMGLIISRRRQAGTRWYRDYDEDVVETIEKVRQAQQLGFSLKEIGPLLQAYGKKPPTKAEAVVFLGERLKVIREKMDALRNVERFIVAKLTHYEKMSRSCPSPATGPGGRGTRRPASAFASNGSRRRGKPVARQ